MKPYYLRFKSSDFFKSGNTWRTPVIDLYSNSQYVNYLAKKSPYGTDLLGDGTYTGMNLLNATTTEIGFVSNGRFVDTSGRIDILNWAIDFPDDITADISTNLAVYTADSSSATPYYQHATPSLVSDWRVKADLEPGDAIYFIDSSRYVFFELKFVTDLASIANINILLMVSVEIDPPVVNGYFPATRRLQDKFPEWMDIREYNPNNIVKATPDSLGGKFLNAVAGEWLSDISSKVQYQQYQQYIDTVDLSQKAWVYCVSAVPGKVWSVIGDGVSLTCAANVNEFYDSNLSQDIYLWNKYTSEIYTNKKYNSLFINYDASAAASTYTFTQNPYHVWNSVDDIGVHVDMFRIQSATPNGYLEDNDSFRKRIIDVYKNPPSVSIDAFKKVLRREFNLWKYSGATPNSDYLGATPNVYEISDLENDPKYWTAQGLPTQAFKDLVEELAKKYPMTWGYFKYGQAFWDADGIGHKGFNTLPRQLDATPVTEPYLESGVGDGNDMYVFKPKPKTGKTSFSTEIKLRGRQRTTRSEYLPLTFDVKVYGRAAEIRYANPVTTGNFTIELRAVDMSSTPSSPSSTVYYSNITVTDQSAVDFYSATPYGVLVDWVTVDGYTSANYIFKNKLTGVALPDGKVDLRNVYRVDIKPGHYNGNFATPSYLNAPTQAYYKSWFVSTPGTIMGAGGGTVLTKNPFNWATESSFYFQSQQVLNAGATPNNWVSDSYTYTIKLNGVQPNQTQQNYTLTLPVITFPPSTSSREIVVELMTNQGGTYGAYADKTAATPIFLPYSYLNVNGNNTWAGNYQKTFSTATTSIAFSSGSGVAYPSTVSVWNLFNSTSKIVTGIVDENGPYRYGSPQRVGSTNNNLTTLNLTRDDFGVPNTIDYIITWIGIASTNNSDVVTWLDSNTVKPVVIDAGETKANFIYPDTAIVETYNISTGKYEFNGVQIYAKLKPGVNKEWNPKVHSGWFHDDVDEYYTYASPGTVTATGNFVILSDVNRQGAPIIVKGISGATPSDIRQVALYDDSATPVLGFTNTQVISGNGTNQLFVSYAGIYNINVTDSTVNLNVPLAYTSTLDNIVTTVSNTISTHKYTITYTPSHSFYADNDYIDGTTNKTKIVFDKSAPQNNFTSYEVNYETSVYDPATPIDIPLNGLYTSIDEGFIFINHDIRPLSQVEVKISPSKLVADGNDFALITLRALDVDGNPSPNKAFNVFTNYGTLNRSTVTTDRDGFAFAQLQSTYWSGATPIVPATPALQPATPGGSIQGQILVDGLVDAKLAYQIQIPQQPQYNITSVLDSDYLLSDGRSSTFLFGLVENQNHQPVPYAAVYWRKARTLYELFNKVSWSTSGATPGNNKFSGLVYADVNGRFTIGPFVSSTSPGYWITSVESGSASPNISANQFNLAGDTVYWYEHPNVTTAIDPITGLPVNTVQDATPSWTIPSYTANNKFITTYDEATPSVTITGATPAWLPPKWWAINKYRQYQMGATPAYPEYKEF